jgi:DNA invertase Pin-like site-specific DNA recombinase
MHSLQYGVSTVPENPQETASASGGKEIADTPAFYVPTIKSLLVRFFLTLNVLRIILRNEIGGNQMNAALYARVSTKSGRQDTDNQLRQLREFCRKQEWEIVEEYVDRATGKHSDREQFQAMFAAASRREFDLVLFWSLDRFSREGTVETLQHLQRLTSYGVAWRSFTEQCLDSTGFFRDAVIGILAAVAKQERVRLSERVVAGLERAKVQGRIGGRPRVRRERDRDAAKIREMRDEGDSYTD